MIKKIKRSMIHAFTYLNESKTSLRTIDKKPFDPMLGEYLYLLFASGVLHALTYFAIGMLQALYYDYIKGAQVNYFGVFNYSLGIAVSMFFLWIFIFTLLMLLISFLVSMVVKKKYMQLLRCILFSVTPMLLFGWIPLIGMGSIIWSIYLFILALKT